MRTTDVFETGHAGLAAWLLENFGEHADGKTIPGWAFGMSAEFRQALLDGYMSADGHDGKVRLEAGSVSKSLIIGVRLLAESLGNRVSLYFDSNERASKIEGREFTPKPMYRAIWRKTRQFPHEQTAEFDGHSWMQVKEISNGRAAVVYNLSVADDESYVADGIVVHNCTHFTNAGGGMPLNRQLRATIKYVQRFITRLDIDDVLIENVREFTTWGPLHRTHGPQCKYPDHSLIPKDPDERDENHKCWLNRPIESRKGEYFRRFITWLQGRGYRVEWRILNCADYGDATSRKRLFIRARKKKLGRIIWPEATHCDPKLIGQPTMFETPKLPWRTARDILDLTDKGTSIFNRKKPLSPNTIRRIMTGLYKFSGLPFVLPNEGVYRGNQPRSMDEPLNTVTGGRGAGHVAQPYLIQFHGTSTANDIDTPLPSHPAQGKHIGVVQPFVIGAGGTTGNGRPKSVEEPLNTVLGDSHLAVVQPFVLGQQSAAAPRKVDQPMPSIATDGAISVIQPFVLGIRGGNDGYTRGVSADEPLPAITTEPAMAVVQPWLIAMEHGGRELPADQPVPTITTAKGGAFGVAQIEPFIVGTGGRQLDPTSIDDPMRAVIPNHRLNVVQPKIVRLVPTNHGKDDARSHDVDEPMPAQTSVDAMGLAQYLVEFHAGENADQRVKGLDNPLPTQDTSNRMGVVQPFLIEYYGTGTATSVDSPLPTQTGRDRYALCIPLQSGYAIVDILFRMVRPDELARAHSMDDYVFEGTREQIVKQIGNSVPRRTAMALALSMKARDEDELLEWQRAAIRKFLVDKPHKWE